MTRDKQLRCIKLEAVKAKQRQDQALNVKEFAVLAGISYSVAREWFQLSGFPAICGKVFWQDFVLWRRARNAPRLPSHNAKQDVSISDNTNHLDLSSSWPVKAARILHEAANNVS